MKVVIQCAGEKSSNAGKLRNQHGVRVFFVASPDLYREETKARAYRPDDPAEGGLGTWRDVLVRYNERYQREGENPDGLLTAGDLYGDSVYRKLVKSFGPSDVYLLSGGWGLVRSDFLLPDYNITFSTQQRVDSWAWRSQQEDSAWKDFNQLRGHDLSPNEPVHFFAGRDYQWTYHRLTKDLPAPKVIHYVAANLRRNPGYDYRRYPGKKGTNWHYRAAEKFINEHSSGSE